MRSATNKNASGNTKKLASKSIKFTPQKTSQNEITKPISKPLIQKTMPKAATSKTASITIPPKSPNKQSQLIALLKDPKGSDIKMLMQATGWQAHSVRGVISGILKKKLGMNIVSSKVNGTRRYRIEHLTAA